MKRIISTAIALALTYCIHAQSNATQIEYFLDTDNGIGLNTVLDITSPDTDITQSVLADIPAATPLGYHKLYIRVKDADGNWSLTTRKHIEIVASTTQNNIVLGEYFIDEDPEFGTATSFAINPEEEDVAQAFSAQILANTSIGYHKLYGRVKDSRGNWSHTFRKNIEVYLNPVKNIVEIEYFFDGDMEFGNNNIVSIGTPEADGSWTFNVPYPEGSYDFNDVLFIRVKDSNNSWSITTVVDEVASLGIEDNLLKSTKIYPNPFEDAINIISAKSLSIKNITIYNTLGKVVHRQNFDSHQLDLGFLPQGVYFLQLTSTSGKASYKIVKH